SLYISRYPILNADHQYLKPPRHRKDLELARSGLQTGTLIISSLTRTSTILLIFNTASREEDSMPVDGESPIFAP
ncbi:MAG: hypothetical protein KAX50_08865, partial [Saprospiraceae bacterium]|nr:hypothetical protein [Saprospiraceae bacterium]